MRFLEAEFVSNALMRYRVPLGVELVIWRHTGSVPAFKLGSLSGKKLSSEEPRQGRPSPRPSFTGVSALESGSQGAPTGPREMGWPTLWTLWTLLCLGPSRALGQGEGACPGERRLLCHMGTPILVYACMCGSRKWDVLEEHLGNTSRGRLSLSLLGGTVGTESGDSSMLH